jgi:hypothetical protein
MPTDKPYSGHPDQCVPFRGTSDAGSLSQRFRCSAKVRYRNDVLEKTLKDRSFDMSIFQQTRDRRRYS